MRPGSMNGQGHVTKARSDMTLQELHAAYDALFLDKMQVVDQKDRLFERLKGTQAELRDAQKIADEGWAWVDEILEAIAAEATVFNFKDFLPVGLASDE